MFIKKGDKWMRHFLLLVLLLTTIGCSQKTIYQVDGLPIHDNIIKAKTFVLNLTIKYNLTEYFEVKENGQWIIEDITNA